MIVLATEMEGVGKMEKNGNFAYSYTSVNALSRDWRCTKSINEKNQLCGFAGGERENLIFKKLRESGISSICVWLGRSLLIVGMLAGIA